MNVGFFELSVADDKIFFSSNAKQLLQLDVKGNFFTKASFAQLFSNAEEVLSVLNTGGKSLLLSTPNGADGTIQLVESDDKLVGVLKVG